MDILLMDGVKYIPYEYEDEKELEQMIVEHYKDIFGKTLFILKKVK